MNFENKFADICINIWKQTICKYIFFFYCQP